VKENVSDKIDGGIDIPGKGIWRSIVPLPLPLPFAFIAGAVEEA